MIRGCTFTKGMSPKMNIITWLGFELAYYDIAVKNVRYYANTPQARTSIKLNSTLYHLHLIDLSRVQFSLTVILFQFTISNKHLRIALLLCNSKRITIFPLMFLLIKIKPFNSPYHPKVFYIINIGPLFCTRCNFLKELSSIILMMTTRPTTSDPPERNSQRNSIGTARKLDRKHLENDGDFRS